MVSSFVADPIGEGTSMGIIVRRGSTLEVSWKWCGSFSAASMGLRKTHQQWGSATVLFLGAVAAAWV